MHTVNVKVRQNLNLGLLSVAEDTIHDITYDTKKHHIDEMVPVRVQINGMSVLCYVIESCIARTLQRNRSIALIQTAHDCSNTQVKKEGLLLL